MPEPLKIKCQYCGNLYVANKKTRSHCRRTDCRDKEIERQLSMLQVLFGLFCDNNIEAKIEIRLPGNDKISYEAKVDSISNLSDTNNTNPKEIKKEKNIEEVHLLKLISYFKMLLWKGIKGNFIINTFKNGTINPKVLNQTFTPLSMPVIIGNNLLVRGQISDNKK